MTPERGREVEQVYQSTMDLAPGTQLGPYRIEAMLGAGGMGRVYRSHDTRLGRTVALKISRVEFTERFECEARAVAALNHPNICTIYDVGPNYLVMELIEGETLKGPLPLETALHYARQIADALEAAHEKGIVHRDLKPGNIKIKPDGTVKVLDFGLAKLRPVEIAPGTKPEDSPTISMAATTAGMILGTAAYMSPEQARGKVVDKRADIWAFGVVLHEMLTGRRLFDGEDVTETLALVIKGEPKWDGIPANVQRLLKACLEKDPAHRLRDIGDAWRVLEAASDLTVASRSRLGIVAWIVAAVAVVGFAALAFVHFREQPPRRDLARFQISPPEKTRFEGNPYVSPDGRRVAFNLRGADGRSQLWIRSLDSLVSTPVAGTEDVVNTGFWSPDSRFLGFVAQGKLKKVDASGGPPQTLCDLPSVEPGPSRGSGFRAGAWGREGVIVFGVRGSGLWRVSDAGGVPSPITKLDPSRRESFHGVPDFLPDGRHFLYARVMRDEGDNAIYIGSLDATPEQQSATLLPGTAAGAVYVPASGPDSSTGHVLFSREGSLMAQGFDVRRLQLSGEAVPIAEGMVYAGPRPFSVSTTGVLAYRTGVDTGGFAGLTQLTWFDRQGKALGTAGEPGQFNSLALSPDGSRVAVSRAAPGGVRGASGVAHDIWVHETARGTSTRLTSDPAIDWLATWSPDGSRLIFSSERDGSAFNLYQKLASGAGDEELLFKSTEDKSSQDWSRDGRFLLYSVAVSGARGGGDFRATSQDLWVLPLTAVNPGGRKPEIYLKTEFNESQARFSPDGRFIAYGSDLSGRDEIYVRPFPAASAGKWTVSTGGGVAPRWRADGKELFYISADSKMMAVEVSTRPVFKAGIPKMLFHAPIWGGASFRVATRYDVTADGNKFLINSVLMNAGAPAPSPITVVLNWTALLKK
jgi:eukaryotic-like serine/threonine-protein kinase